MAWYNIIRESPDRVLPHLLTPIFHMIEKQEVIERSKSHERKCGEETLTLSKTKIHGTGTKYLP